MDILGYRYRYRYRAPILCGDLSISSLSHVLSIQQDEDIEEAVSWVDQVGITYIARFLIHKWYMYVVCMYVHMDLW